MKNTTAHRAALLWVCLALVALQALTASASSNEAVFTQRNCARCHDTTGRGGTPGPPVTNMEVEDTFLDFGASLWNHGPSMVKQAEAVQIPLPHLEARDIPAIFSFLAAAYSRRKERSSPGDAMRGEIAWKGLKCAGCHSLGTDPQKLGTGLSAYKNMSPVQMVQAMWKHSPGMSKAMTEHGIAVPRVTGSQMTDILAYIRSSTGMKDAVIYTELGDPIRGAEVFRKKQCVSCHPVADSATQYGPQIERSAEFREGTAGVAALMWNHSVGMRDDMTKAGLVAPTFEGSEMADLLAYLYVSTFSEPPGDPALGKKLFELKKCTACHQAGGSASGKAPRPAGVSAFSIIASMWNHLPSMEGRGTQGSAFPTIKPGEMRHLVAYLETARTSP